jgi:hypothetical protein
VPGDPGRLGTPIYIFTDETPRPVEARHNSCTQLLWKRRDLGRQGTLTSVVTAETSRCGQAGHTHLLSYRGNLKNVSYMPVYYNFVAVPEVIAKTQIMCVYIYITL